jgi:hypothetical protein
MERNDVEQLSQQQVAAIEPLWTWAEVAAYLRKSESWVRHKTADGTLPSMQIGGARRYDAGTIRAYALRQHQSKTSLKAK